MITEGENRAGAFKKVAFIVCFLLGEFLHVHYLQYFYEILEKPTAWLLEK